MTTKVKVRFGQIVIGPPGSGKTTYCDGMAQFLRTLGRPVAIVNLDPANDELPYKADIDISDLVRLEEVKKAVKQHCFLSLYGSYTLSIHRSWTSITWVPTAALYIVWNSSQKISSGYWRKSNPCKKKISTS